MPTPSPKSIRNLLTRNIRHRTSKARYPAITGAKAHQYCSRPTTQPSQVRLKATTLKGFDSRNFDTALTADKLEPNYLQMWCFTGQYLDSADTALQKSALAVTQIVQPKIAELVVVASG